MIDQITIDRIIDAAQIVDVVSQFVTLKRRGINYVGLCPFHTDKTPSFYVSPSKNICKCFACGEGGTAVHFIMKHEQLSYYEALKSLAKKYGIEVEEKEFTDEQKKAYNERESLFIINEYARDYFVNILSNHAEGKAIGLSYFKERGFRDDIIEKFQLGYSLEQRDAFTQDALKAGYNKEFLVKTGLTIEGDNYTTDRFRGRVMFPIHTLSGKVVAFGGRILKKAENTGKYVNSPESEIYHKGNELYGIFFAKQSITKADCCFLVEGYTDVISMHQAGIENVVASSGTALTIGQIKLIHRFTNNVTVLYDGDTAGIKAALRGIDMLLEEGMNIKVVLLPDGEDPDSFARKQNADSFNNFIKTNEVDFIRFKTQLLLGEAGGDPIKRASLISDIVNSISVIPDNIVRAVYLKDCSNLLDIDERILIQEVKKKRQKGFESNQTSYPNKPIEPPADNNFQNYTSKKENGKKATIVSIDKHEYSILYYVVRFGMEKLSGDDPQEPQETVEHHPSVIEYVKYDLERDELWFTNPIYKQMLDEAVARADKGEFVPGRYFLAHPMAEISRIAADLISDKYHLSKIHTKQFGENVKKEDTPLAEERHLLKNVPRVLTELKDAYVTLQLKEITDELVKLKGDDIERERELMNKLLKLKHIKMVLDKELGEKIITRY